jgi:phage-related protein
MEDDGRIPLLEWLLELDPRTRKKADARIKRLKAWGHELRRPIADFLRDGIYELRMNHGKVQYRILYFFQGTSIVVLSHALRKTDIVPPREIEKAMERKEKFERDPGGHKGGYQI